MIVVVNDPRTAGLRALRQVMALPADDKESRLERKLLRRMDIREAVQR